MTGWRDKLAFYSDCMLLGTLVTLTLIPVVTAPAGFAAACWVIAWWRAGNGTRLVPAFVTVLRARLAANLLAGLAFLCAVGLLVINITLAATVLPGGSWVRWAVVVASVGGFAVLVRAAALVGTRGLHWLPAIRQAAMGVGETALVTVALGVLAVLVWALPPLGLLAGGPLALAATASVVRWPGDRPSQAQ